MNAVSYAVNSDALQPIFQLTSRGINVDQLYKKSLNPKESYAHFKIPVFALIFRLETYFHLFL